MSRYFAIYRISDIIDIWKYLRYCIPQFYDIGDILKYYPTLHQAVVLCILWNYFSTGMTGSAKIDYVNANYIKLYFYEYL